MKHRSIAMKEHELLELYQLLREYYYCYDRSIDAAAVLAEIEDIFADQTNGKDVTKLGNPRRAGRKKTYSEETNNKILELRNEGKTVREVAALVGCSIKHVEDVIR